MTSYLGLSDYRITVIGNDMPDCYIFCTVSHICPRYPYRWRVTDEHAVPGGATDVAANRQPGRGRRRAGWEGLGA